MRPGDLTRYVSKITVPEVQCYKGCGKLATKDLGFALIPSDKGQWIYGSFSGWICKQCLLKETLKDERINGVAPGIGATSEKKAS